MTDKELWEKSQVWDGSDDGRGKLKILESVEKFAQLVRADERARMAEQPAQQEPVAWAMYQKGHLLSFWMDKGDAYDFEFTSEHSWRPLYTTPQPAQRKPLTDEEIYMHCPSWLSQEQCKTWVRQIEAAHGIKENT